MGLPRGKTNNPLGRPRKNRTLTDLLDRYRKAKVTVRDERGEDELLTAEAAIVRMIWQHAIYGRDMTAAKYIFDRLDGKPVETLRAQIDRGDVPVIKAIQKELFNSGEMETEEDEGALEPPAETGQGAGE